MNNFTNRQERARKAKLHTESMAKRYEKEIKEAVENTKEYSCIEYVNERVYDVDPEPMIRHTDNRPKVVFMNTDSVSAIFASKGKKIAVLNFASYKNPGGMFYDGSSAQEESLCHESFLYNVLREFNDSYYEFNRNHVNKAQYMNRALYTPKVVFEHMGMTKECDVITCAAPNYAPAIRYGSVTKDENSRNLELRIKFIRMIVDKNEPDTLILGAFGAGVFKQDATEVAALFEKHFADSGVGTIVYAVPGNDKNTKAFSERFGKR